MSQTLGCGPPVQNQLWLKLSCVVNVFQVGPGRAEHKQPPSPGEFLNAIEAQVLGPLAPVGASKCWQMSGVLEWSRKEENPGGDPETPVCKHF